MRTGRPPRAWTPAGRPESRGVCGRPERLNRFYGARARSFQASEKALHEQSDDKAGERRGDNQKADGYRPLAGSFAWVRRVRPLCHETLRPR
jgi:hypothetical protein